MERVGFVGRVAGVVVDAEFPSGDLPGIHNALRVEGAELRPSHNYRPRLCCRHSRCP